MLSQVHEQTLPNNLRIITVPMDAPSVSALVLVGAGSRYESKKEAGLSHFLEHMMFKGTKNRPTTLDIVQEVDGIGGEYNAYTSKDHTGYYIKAAVKHLPKLVEILADMTLNSLLKQEEIDREKGVIIQEKMMYEDTPIRRVEEVYENLLYGDTPLGREIIGSQKTITSFQHTDFISYMNRLYRPSNVVVVIAGGVNDIDRTIDLVQKHFGSWKDEKTPHYDSAKQAQIAPAITVIKKKTEQTHVCIGTYGYSRTDPKRYAAGLLTAVLGGGMSSRLFHQVRERRGLAYYVKMWANRYQDSGNVVVQAGVDINKLEEVIRVIVSEFQGISKKGYTVPDEELLRAKEYTKGHLILSMEDSMSVAQFVGNAALLDSKIRTLKQTLESIDKVTKDDIAAVSQELLVQNKLNVAVIGPVKEGLEGKLANIIG
ncbi:MAG: insulinase family protein [Candidatus Roizmanbacteria bacterium]|nr:insulinase family protein [Candidatus Roizmanbacteria bacterium]